ncbi:MAG: ribonuclease protein component [Thermoleophilia bacterium]|nr:ribonuclease protein component [Thermoleophilia bacterium]
MADTARRSRLSRSAEFDRVYRQGRSAQHRVLILYRFERPDEVAAAADGGHRVGVTVSKKIGGAVQRNRLKRQLNAALRESRHLDAACDYVAIARPGLIEMSDGADGFETLKALVDELAAKLQPPATPGARRVRAADGQSELPQGDHGVAGGA